MNLYVIMVDRGEYSDRTIWIGGVYDNKETAQKLVIEKSEEADLANQEEWDWIRKRQNIWNRVNGNYELYGHLTNEDVQKIIDTEIGKAPSDWEGGDRFYVIEVPLNQWGKFIPEGGA